MSPGIVDISIHHVTLTRDTSIHVLQLIIGDFGLSLDQQRSQMALWAIFAAVSDGYCKVYIMYVISTCYYIHATETTSEL